MFVANPKKPPQIESILRRNKDKLLKFLKDFHNDKEGSFIAAACTGCIRSLTSLFALDEQFMVSPAEALRRHSMALTDKLTPSIAFQDEKQFLIVQIQNL